MDQYNQIDLPANFLGTGHRDLDDDDFKTETWRQAIALAGVIFKFNFMPR